MTSAPVSLIPIGDQPDPRAEASLHPALVVIANWIRQSLTRPHPDLGRKGSVCPFVTPALRRHSVFLACEPGEPTVELTLPRMRTYADRFGDLATSAHRDRIYLTALVAFPDLAPSRYVEVIEGVQAQLKREFMSKGFMIGEFHPGPPSQPGLWNPDFRPFHSPIPLLAIRHMVAADLPFATDNDVHHQLYLDRFGEDRGTDRATADRPRLGHAR